MTIELKKRFGRALAIGALIVLAAVLLSTRKIRELAADPLGGQSAIATSVHRIEGLGGQRRAHATRLHPLADHGLAGADIGNGVGR